MNRYFPVGAFGGDSEDRNALLPLAVERLRLISSAPLNYNDCVVIGDTPLDVACAKEHGARSIAVATGPYSLEILQRTETDLALNNLSQTSEIIAWLKHK